MQLIERIDRIHQQLQQNLDETTIEAIELLLNDSSTWSMEDLLPAERASLERGLAESTRGEGMPQHEVMARLRRRMTETD